MNYPEVCCCCHVQKKAMIFSMEEEFSESRYLMWACNLDLKLYDGTLTCLGTPKTRNSCSDNIATMVI